MPFTSPYPELVFLNIHFPDITGEHLDHALARLGHVRLPTARLDGTTSGWALGQESIDRTPPDATGPPTMRPERGGPGRRADVSGLAGRGGTRACPLDLRGACCALES